MVLFSIFLWFGFSASVAAQLSVTITNKEIVGNETDHLVIGCNFTRTGPFRSNFQIHWYYMNNDNKSTVHAYYDGADRLEDQDVAYLYRTQLFNSEIPNGNASLKLYNLQTSDSGVYQCTVTNGLEQAHDNGSLEVHESDFELKIPICRRGYSLQEWVFPLPSWIIYIVCAVIIAAIIISIIIIFTKRTEGMTTGAGIRQRQKYKQYLKM